MSSVLGSASEQQKELVVNIFREFCGAEGRFGAEQARRIVVKQFDYETKPEGDLGARYVFCSGPTNQIDLMNSTRARLTCELKVESDMLHNADAVSGRGSERTNLVLEP